MRKRRGRKRKPSLELVEAVSRAIRRVLDSRPPRRTRDGSTRWATALLRCSPEQRRLYLANSPGSAEPEVVARLVDLSFASVHDSPTKSLQAAEAAVAAAESLPLEGPLARVQQDLRAEAWCALANARRLNDQWFEAEDAWAIAWKAARAGSADPLVTVQLAFHQASLLISQRKFSEARSLLTTCVRLSETLDERQRLLESHLKVWRAAYVEGDAQGAVDACGRVLALFDEETSDDLRLMVTLAYLHGLEDLLPATQVLPLAKAFLLRAFEAAPPLLLLRCRWLVARLQGAAGQPKGAVKGLEALRREFVERGLVLDAGLVSLDLALVWAQRGGWEQQKRLAEEMLPIFQAFQLPNEAAVAFRLWVDAARSYAADRRFLEGLHRQLTPLRRGGPAAPSRG